MENNPPDKWYFRNTSLIAGFLLAGVFILPLVWANPHFSNRKKITVSIIIIALSCLLFMIFVGSIKSITDFYQGTNNVVF